MTLDERLLLAVNNGWSHPWLDVLFTWLSSQMLLALPLLAVLLWHAVRAAGPRGVRVWLIMLICVGLADLLGGQLKAMIAEPRPCYSHHEALVRGGEAWGRPCTGATTGMPSNHAFTYFAAATALAVTTQWARWYFSLYLVAVLVALSRVYLGKHLPSQVAAGALLGIGLGMLVGGVACYHGWCVRRLAGTRRTPPAPRRGTPS